MRLTHTLLVAMAVSACAAAMPMAAQAQGQRDPAQLLLRADENGDGRITRAEYTQARTRLFDRLDRNKDGIVDERDAPRRRLMSRGNGDQFQQLVNYMDQNGDGRVTRAEFVNGPTPMFDHADTNGDGVIDGPELAAFREAAAALRAQ